MSPEGLPVELTFVEEGPELLLVATDSKAAWAQYSLGAPVQVRFTGGRVERRIGRLVTDSVRIETILASFRAKYGETAWQRYYRGSQRVLTLTLVGGGAGLESEELLRAEFDAVADHYTAAVEQNPFRRYLRDRSVRQVLPLFQGLDPILELGCGTGLETLELLRAGHRVIAVDISPRMIDQLRQRADSAGLSEKLETLLGSIGDLEHVLSDYSSRSLGAVLSTFGALNLDPHLDRLPAVLGRLLPPKAPFFAGILNRFGFVTATYLAVARHPHEAVRRLRNPVVAGGFLYPLEVRPYTSQEFARRFRPGFTLERVAAASVLVPPYWSSRLYAFWGAHGRFRLRQLDRQLSELAPFREFGEYLFLTLRRAGTDDTTSGSSGYLSDR